MSNPPVVLIIRDGWGENPHLEHDAFNAVKLARTPVADRLLRDFPATLIRTSGEDVGLPAGTMGNSEVGHQNIGAGRIVDQELMRISNAIGGGAFFENTALLGAFRHAISHDSNLHLMGLVSNGRVHSDIDHLFALIDLATRLDFPGDRLFIHAFTDGRDTGPRTGLGFLEQLEAKLRDTGVGRIASVIGRFYAMDRDHRWERVEQAFRCLAGGSPSTPPARTAPSAKAAIQTHYDNPDRPNMQGDEFIPPTRIANAVGDGGPGVIIGGDAVIFFNYRGDRPRELTRAFVLDDEEWKSVQNGGFDRIRKLDDLHYCTMTAYEEGLPVTEVAFPKPPKTPDILGQVVADAGLTQFRCAETEKFAHVTFFFNDYREEPFPGESRVIVPSPTDVSTYDQKPRMSAQGVCEAVLKRIGGESGAQLIVVNFANGDMVGHTGDLAAVIEAIEVVDACVGSIVHETLGAGGSLIITADHGNAEQMWNPQHDCPHTAHTTYDVPLIVVGEAFKGQELREGGRLADIAPTVLAMMGIDQPSAMTGESLLEV